MSGFSSKYETCFSSEKLIADTDLIVSGCFFMESLHIHDFCLCSPAIPLLSNAVFIFPHTQRATGKHATQHMSFYVVSVR